MAKIFAVIPSFLRIPNRPARIRSKAPGAGAAAAVPPAVPQADPNGEAAAFSAALEEERLAAEAALEALPLMRCALEQDFVESACVEICQTVTSTAVTFGLVPRTAV